MDIIGRHLSELSGYAPAVPTPFDNDQSVDSDVRCGVLRQLRLISFCGVRVWETAMSNRPTIRLAMFRKIERHVREGRPEIAVLMVALCFAAVMICTALIASIADGCRRYLAVIQSALSGVRRCKSTGFERAGVPSFARACRLSTEGSPYSTRSKRRSNNSW
jgi:hypothetical protein